MFISVSSATCVARTWRGRGADVTRRAADVIVNQIAYYRTFKALPQHMNGI